MGLFDQLLKLPGRRPRDFASVLRDLLRIKGEASAVKLAREVLARYADVEDEEKIEFFEILAQDFGPDDARLNDAIDAYQSTHEVASYLELQRAIEPHRQDIIRMLNWVPGGTAAIISMRSDLLRLGKDKAWQALIDSDFRHLLTSWFNRGFLHLERISWRTPALFLEKLIDYESVHEISDWSDLRRRLAHDRRCFAFTHPQLPDEPLIFVEVALTKGLVSNIDDVLLESSTAEKTNTPDTAIFYSINNCQKGLSGISFGNFLIKQVADELAQETPSLRHFATLSPIPGFRRWLDSVRANPDDVLLGENERQNLGQLDLDQWWQDESALKSLEPLMRRLCAHYLVQQKRGDEPADPVARFHLSNGARIERINWLGDRSRQRLTQSYGMLVNYVYDRRSVIKNHEEYVAKGRVAASSTVNASLK